MNPPPELSALGEWPRALVDLLAAYSPDAFAELFLRCAAGDLSAARWLEARCPAIARPSALDLRQWHTETAARFAFPIGRLDVENPRGLVLVALCVACAAGCPQVAEWLWSLGPLEHWRGLLQELAAPGNASDADGHCARVCASSMVAHHSMAAGLALSHGLPPGLLPFGSAPVDPVRRHMLRKMLEAGRWAMVVYVPRPEVFVAFRFIRISDGFGHLSYAS